MICQKEVYSVIKEMIGQHIVCRAYLTTKEFVLLNQGQFNLKYY